MKFDIEALSAPPPTFFHWGAFGLEKRGKTTITMKLAMMLARATGKKIALVDAENMRSDWYERVVSVLGEGSILQFPPLSKAGGVSIPSPQDVLAFVQWCEAQGDPPILLIDSMTVLQNYWRKKHVEKTGKSIPLNAYATIDKPYKELCDYLQNAQIHWLTTFRETDDKQEMDGDEKVVGKKGKAGGFEYVPRTLCHCTLSRYRGGTKFVSEVRDCSKGELLRIVKAESDGEVTSTDLAPILSRFIGEAA